LSIFETARIERSWKSFAGIYWEKRCHEMTDDFKTTLAKTAIKTIIKYYLRPDLAKKRKREFSESTKKRVLMRQNYRCMICDKPYEDLQFDHIDGNSFNNHHLNCQALCPNCHDKKTRQERMLKKWRFRKRSRI